MLFGKKKTQKTPANVVSGLNQKNKNDRVRETSDKQNRIKENKEEERDWIDELTMLDEIFDDD